MNQPPPPPNTSWPPPAYAAPAPTPLYDRDSDHLRLLSILYYIWGGLTMLGSCMFIFYIFMGATMKNVGIGPAAPGQPAMPFPASSFANMMALIGVIGLVVGWLLGGLTVYAGYCLARCKRLVLIMIVAALNCLSIPLGTVLGVFTFVVTSRPTVKVLFDAGTGPL